MKDIIIKGNQIKKEIIIWLVCFFSAVLLNVYAIVIYDTGWVELLSQLHIVLLVSCVIYFFVGIIRIAFNLLMRMVRKKESG